MSTVNGNGSRPIAIRAEGLSKHYRLGELHSLTGTVKRIVRPRALPPGPGLEALADVNLTVHQGEAIGIVGTNGSGKSTLLQILAGTTLPTSGRMRVRGRVLSLLAVGQNFHPELTGRENVALFASSLGIPRAAIAAGMEAVTEFAELERHMDTPVKRFSSGMSSRLSAAIAVQFPADIYVFDEVLAVVDSEFQSRCIEAIRQLNRTGSTIIFVSHDNEQVAEVCERVVWLEKGKLRDTGPTAAVLDAYEHAHGASEAA